MMQPQVADLAEANAVIHQKIAGAASETSQHPTAPHSTFTVGTGARPRGAVTDAGRGRPSVERYEVIIPIRSLL
jgi:hypothetical protein